MPAACRSRTQPQVHHNFKTVREIDIKVTLEMSASLTERECPDPEGYMSTTLAVIQVRTFSNLRNLSSRCPHVRRVHARGLNIFLFFCTYDTRELELLMWPVSSHSHSVHGPHRVKASNHNMAPPLSITYCSLI